MFELSPREVDGTSETLCSSVSERNCNLCNSFKSRDFSSSADFMSLVRAAAEVEAEADCDGDDGDGPIPRAAIRLASIAAIFGSVVELKRADRSTLGLMGLVAVTGVAAAVALVCLALARATLRVCRESIAVRIVSSRFLMSAMWRVAEESDRAVEPWRLMERDACNSRLLMIAWSLVILSLQRELSLVRRLTDFATWSWRIFAASTSFFIVSISASRAFFRSSSESLLMDSID